MIAFVILHYQALEETIHCIESIKLNVKDEKKIIVVDNGSPNKSGVELKTICKEDGEIEVLLNEENLGFAKGNNLGYNVARKLGPDFIVVLNSDTLIRQDRFSEMVEAAYEKYSFDVMGPDIFSTRTSSHQNPQRETNYSLKELKKTRFILVIKNRLKWAIKLKYWLFHPLDTYVDDTHKNYNTAQIGKVLHGAFYIFSKKFIEKHERCFYNETFMYFESYILHYLGMKEGLVFLYEPKIQIVHHEDVSTDVIYTTRYKKSVFENQWLLDSCEKFINLQKENGQV